MWTKDNIKQDPKKLPDCYTECENNIKCEHTLVLYKNVILLMGEEKYEIHHSH